MKIKSDYDHLFKVQIPRQVFQEIVIGYPNLKQTMDRWTEYHQAFRQYSPPIIPNAVIWLMTVNFFHGRMELSTLEDALAIQGIELDLSKYEDIEESEPS